MLAHEESGDVRVLNNRIFRTKSTYIGFCTENIDEFNILRNNDNYHHIVYTDRTTILPDMKTIKGTQTISQVEGIKGSSAANSWEFKTSIQPCSCPPCLLSSSSDTCLYNTEREIKTHKVSDKLYDPEGIGKLTVTMLKKELQERLLEINSQSSKISLKDSKIEVLKRDYNN